MSDAGNARDKKLSLGALPSASSALDAGIAQLAATTPKAPVEQQLRTSSTLHSGGTSLPAIRETRKKSVSQVLDPIAGLQQEAASQVGKKRDSGTDEGSISENTTTNPYDGDVEFAAPSTHSPAPIAVAGAFASSQHTGGSPHLASRLQLAIPTAPDETPSKTFVTQAPGGNTDSDAAYSRSSKPISAPSATEIRKAIHQAIFEPSPQRTYQINPPRDGGKNPARPIRIYADGVYDLFHYAHMLQLRQAKLSFQSVYLIVGVVSSAACAAHKNEPVMTSQERYASVRNCRWVDEVVEDAPWVITQELIDRYQIDYVAHDDLPYAGAGSSASMTDIYQFAKEQGRFLPTQRTEGVSTSELLARIVEQYRNHNYDQKLTKIGHEELTFH
jgi:choline-phosphate cytidylyltransferase